MVKDRKKSKSEAGIANMLGRDKAAKKIKEDLWNRFYEVHALKRTSGLADNAAKQAEKDSRFTTVFDVFSKWKHALNLPDEIPLEQQGGGYGPSLGTVIGELLKGPSIKLENVDGPSQNKGCSRSSQITLHSVAHIVAT